jgi:amino acid permease
MGLTLMFGTPVVTLPCRAACLSFISQIQSRWKQSEDLAILQKISELNALVETAHTRTILLDSNMDSYSSFTAGEAEIDEGICNISAEYSNAFEVEMSQDHITFAHVGITFMIAAFAFFGAVSVPGIAFVWSILGSSLGMSIGFIIPASCYLKIRGAKGLGRNTNMGALALLVFSILVAVVCTIQTILSPGTN